MSTKFPQKLQKIIEDIKTQKQANITRLTVLKKWFEKPSRLEAFSLFIAKCASERNDNPEDESAEALFHDARKLLAQVTVTHSMIDRDQADKLLSRLIDFQNEYKKISWGQVRIIKSHNMLLIEEGLRSYFHRGNFPVEGYRLAACYCEHYNPSYGGSLNGPSVTKIQDILGFVRSIEALEDGEELN